ncbi:MAG TPA: CpaF family protein, partial [Solirubrobacterales bacterium]|nr:CpaF family protein [Solirubrobacterales bacterium]
MEARERNVAELASRLRERLIERRRVEAAAGRGNDEDLATSVRALVDEQAAILPTAEREEVAERIVRDSVGLGPLEVLLADPAVEEVMVNGPGRVYMERRGLVEATDVRFESEEELRDTIERILAPL